MSYNLKTIKELADELGISKKYLQNKISYETKKQGLSIGSWKIISGKKTRILSDKEQDIIKGWLDKRSDYSGSLGDKQSNNSDSLEDKRSDYSGSLGDKQSDNSDSLEDKRSDYSDSLGDKQSNNSDSLGDKRSNHSDSDLFYLKERITSLEIFLNKEQESNAELRTIIQQTQNLLDQQQRLALQDKKLLDEYKAENNHLKALEIPSQVTQSDKAGNQNEPNKELDTLKSDIRSLQEQLKEQAEIDQHEVTRKWWQIWK